MKIENIDVKKTLDEARAYLAQEKAISPAFKAIIEVMILIVGLMFERLGKNSSNSSKPPSTDPHREKKKRKDKEKQKKPGGQNGHNGATLSPVKNPDEIVDLKIAPNTLPEGMAFKEVGFEARQVINIKFSKIVTEYRAQILEDTQGNRYKAPFPDFVTQAIQ